MVQLTSLVLLATVGFVTGLDRRHLTHDEVTDATSDLLTATATIDLSALTATPLLTPGEGGETYGTLSSSDNNRKIRKQEREQRRRKAEARRLNRDRQRRQRELRRLQRLRGSTRHMKPKPATQLSLQWIAANISSLWEAVRRLEQEHDFGEEEHFSTERNMEVLGSLSRCDPSELSNEECEVKSAGCLKEEGAEPCDGRGECCCGACWCHDPFYGRFCECAENGCPRHDGVECGGQGECVCGVCQCRAEYTGPACGCPTDTAACTNTRTGQVCSGSGACVCGKCVCTNGHFGAQCEQSSYSASVCEELKPCVLCKALGRTLPQCVVCGEVRVQRVHSLESSYTTCRMVHSGCLLQYTYLKTSETGYDVTVPEDMSC